MTTSTMPVLEWKTGAPATLETLDLSPVQTKMIGATEAEGRVQAIVAVTGNEDSGGDVIHPGAFKFARHPKIVWAHDLKTLVGRVDNVEEWAPGDPRLPADLAAKGLGGLVFDVQFDLTDPDGFKAFRKVLFHPDLGWSIGYSVEPGGAERDDAGRRHLKSITVWEASPLAFGMNDQARTLDVKGALDQVLPDETKGAVADQVALLVRAAQEEAADEAGTPEKKTWPPLAGSLEERREKLRALVETWAEDNLGDRSDDDGRYRWWVSIEGTYVDRVVWSVEPHGEDRSFHEADVTESEDGTLTLGDVRDVEVVADVKDDQAPRQVKEKFEISAEEKAVLYLALGEEKAGRILATRNADRIRRAVAALAEVMDEVDSTAEDDETGGKGDGPDEAKALPTAAFLEHLERARQPIG